MHFANGNAVLTVAVFAFRSYLPSGYSSSYLAQVCSAGGTYSQLVHKE